MTTPPSPPSGPTGPQPEPPKPSKGTPSDDSKYAFLLKSPFAKMFRATGVEPTIKEIRAIINGILMDQVRQIKQQDAQWKKAMEHMKKVIEGRD